MPIEDKVDWDEVPEELLLNIVPIDDSEYGGDKPTALRNARRMYMLMRPNSLPEYINQMPKFKDLNKTKRIEKISNVPEDDLGSQLLKELYNDSNDDTLGAQLLEEIYGEPPTGNKAPLKQPSPKFPVKVTDKEFVERLTQNPILLKMMCYAARTIYQNKEDLDALKIEHPEYFEE